MSAPAGPAERCSGATHTSQVCFQSARSMSDAASAAAPPDASISTSLVKRPTRSVADPT
eukprot:CAMPEP_0202087434 /NCGR_PEP_ID=MMETSP0964-20121228/36149_1 /ASSEMBLY_ACC=CAM_ASM_000500 /TAXON_ID=4773 /ORGANISM="Schizochytrium aggregatum, Strain ATCC28209" /LENGTH=58 /DNA_ID=CAMNT_0048655395 /DNA_START=40 /DNA_END=212 /DNA_ORIENTATION=+